MSKTIVRAGYDFQRRYTLSLDGSPENLASATIKACLKNSTKTATLITSTSLSNTGTADWSVGKVVVAFASTQTAGLAAADQAWIELQVTLGGVKLPYDDIPVVVEAGYL